MARWLFRARCDQNGNRGIGVFPGDQKILVVLTGSRIVATEGRGASGPQLRQRIKRRDWIPAAMIDDRLEFRSSLRTITLFQISLPAQVLRPELAGNLVSLRWLEQLYDLCGIPSFQFQLGSRYWDRYGVEQSILRKCF